jgi:hypothetical protein
MPKFYLPVAIAVVAVLAATYMQGCMSERWGTFPELADFAARMKNVPMNVGEWKGEVGPAVPERERQVAGIEGDLSRIYTNANGDAVTVFLVCGRIKDVFFHTPDRCYPAAGFEMESDPKEVTLETDAGPAEFKTTSFRHSDHTAGGVPRHIYWAWSDGSEWKAPSHLQSKWTFQGHRALYKLYVNSHPTSSTSVPNKDATEKFIKDFVPVLAKSLGDTAAPATPKKA